MENTSNTILEVYTLISSNKLQLSRDVGIIVSKLSHLNATKHLTIDESHFVEYQVILPDLKKQITFAPQRIPHRAIMNLKEQPNNTQDKKFINWLAQFPNIDNLNGMLFMFDQYEIDNMIWAYINDTNECQSNVPSNI